MNARSTSGLARALLLMTLLALGACAAPRSRAPDGPPRERVEALVRGWLAGWQDGDRPAFSALLHPELVFAYPGVRTDLAGTLASFDEFHRDFTGTRVYTHQILVDGDRFVAEYQFATTRRSSGRRQAAGTIAIGRIADDRIVLVKEYVDGRVSRLQEAGELPLQEGSEPFPWPERPATP